MSKIHPKEETYPLQRRFSGAKVVIIFDICKREDNFYGDFGVFAGNSGKG